MKPASDVTQSGAYQELIGTAKAWRSPFLRRRMSIVEKRKHLGGSIALIQTLMDAEPSAFKRAELDVIQAQLEAELGGPVARPGYSGQSQTGKAR